jgi:hypothetical protein
MKYLPNFRVLLHESFGVQKNLYHLCKNKSAVQLTMYLPCGCVSFKKFYSTSGLLVSNDTNTTLTNTEHADIHFVYGYYNGNARAAVEEY